MTYKYRKTFTINGKRVDIRGNTLDEIYDKKLARMREEELPSGDMTLRAWAERCLPLYKVDVTPGSYKTIERRIEKEILYHIGSRRISQIRPDVCQYVLNKQQGRSRSYIDKVHNDLRFLFSRAVRSGILVKDPTQNLIKPKGTYKPRRSLTPEEREIVIKTIRKDPRYILFGLMLYCGCRPSEAAEIKVKDITETDGVYMMRVRGVKTRSADRIVPIPTELYLYIKNASTGVYAASTRNGDKYTENTRSNLWRSFWKECNRTAGCKTYRNQLIPPYPFPEDLSPYCLRHEYCTDLARKGIDIRTAQRLMGHSTIQLTADIYTHVQTAELTKAAVILGAGCGNECGNETAKH